MAPSFHDSAESASARPYPEPLEMPAYSEPAEDPARPMFDAEGKIAAEAYATAEALDNLKHLLAQGTPEPQEPTEPADHAHARLNLYGDPSPFPSSGPAALMPMPLPVAPDGRSRRIYLLGFLTGLGLSLMAGIALYVLINML